MRSTHLMLLLLLVACQPRSTEPASEQPSDSDPATSTASAQALPPVDSPPPASEQGAPENSDLALPTLGDPLGLLSKPKKEALVQPHKLDPGALMAKDAQPGTKPSKAVSVRSKARPSPVGAVPASAAPAKPAL